MGLNPKQLFEEFKSFALKGNVIDLAVGVIIGGAFAKIVDGMVKFIIMPLIGWVASFFAASKPAKDGELPSFGYENIELGPFRIGLFLDTIIQFLILALVLFVVFVKVIGPLMASKKTAPPPELTTQEKLLMEIRDLLKK